MNAFTQKLRIIYSKLFHENIDTFTESLIDYAKFDKSKFDLGSENENRKQFFLNRKTVLRRWLQKGSSCTFDFQKSFKNYKISQLQFKGSALFNLSDFQNNDNIEWFDQRVEDYLRKQRKVQIKTEYKYLYLFSELTQTISYYEITEWNKGEEGETLITLKKREREYEAEFQLSYDNNIFIRFNSEEKPLYMLFHDDNDLSLEYLVGICMGYSKVDNKVPRSQKVLFSKQVLQKEVSELSFLLNETETLSAIENRLNLTSQELKVDPFVKYVNKFKAYCSFFERLRNTSYHENFYYRLAFREFYAIQKLFKRVAKKESYYIMDFSRAFLELIKSVEAIGNIPLQVVMQLNEENIFLQSSRIDLEIRSKILHLKKEFQVKTTIIFVVENLLELKTRKKLLLSEMMEHGINVRIIEKEKIIHKVDSLDFIFIHLNDKRDFVLADPLRDSKDVYKLFTNELTMDEYRTDYQRFMGKSKVYNTEN
jgi:hypothetical protein